MDTYNTFDVLGLDLDLDIAQFHSCSTTLDASDSDVPLDKEQYGAGTTSAFCIIA
jgi:hypothetical protein